MGGSAGPARVLVVGLGVAGRSVAHQLRRRGVAVTAVDDRPVLDPTPARDLGVELLLGPDATRLERAVADADLVVPSPGVAKHHPVFALAATHGVPVWSEFELAARWSDLPVVAITGTNGKTTVTTLVTEMLARSGRRVAAAGNTDVPLVDVLDAGLDMVVVEASSFRLAFTESFRPRVATWLNLAEDHLDWHPSMEDYIDSKARIWANLGKGDVAIANADDPVVSSAARRLDGDVRWFSLRDRAADWWWDAGAGSLVGPDGPFVDAAALPRRLPHDLANALAAAATAVAAGAPTGTCAEVLQGFRGLAHRVALVAEEDGLAWYDDSKATTPASVVAAVGGFASVVLIAGGQNKGLDLSVMARTAPPVHAVVAIGEAAGEVRAAFEITGIDVVDALDMGEAVAAAARLARPGDTVLLSPGCASFDMFRNYGERGDEFARQVRDLTGAPPAPALPGGGH